MKQPTWTRRQIAEVREALEEDYERRASEGDPPVVYFVQVDNGPDSPVKIGVTTEGGLSARLCGIQTSCPYKLPMPKRGPLEQIRKDLTKHSKDIVALKAAVVDLQSRCAKAETALGTIGKSGATPEVEPVIAEDALDEVQQPETE
jgi:hypothetical protein